MAIEDKIYIGAPNSYAPFVFDHASIEHIICNTEVGLIGNELSSDVLEASVFSQPGGADIMQVAYGTAVYYYSGANLVGRFYVEKIERTGYSRYLIRATSLVGIIGKESFYGGMYSEALFPNVVKDILYSDGFGGSYAVYKRGTSTSSTRTSYLSTGEDDIDSWDSSIHLEFILDDYSTTGWSHTLWDRDRIYGGRGQNVEYSVYVFAIKADASAVTHYAVGVNYGNTDNRIAQTYEWPWLYMFGDEEPLFGLGSYFTVDVNPSAGFINVKVDYKKYNNPSVTGTYVKRTPISVFETALEISLRGAFGPTSYWVSSGGNYWGSSTINHSTITYCKQVVYDRTGNAVCDAIASTMDGVTYIINAAADYARTPRAGAGGPSLSQSDYAGTVSRASYARQIIEFDESSAFANGVDQTKVYGWIGVTTKREALHQVLFAENIIMLKNEEGGYLFTRVANAVTASISDDDLYDEGNQQAVDTARQIEVTEHNYFPQTSESEVLFDNSESASVDGEYVALFRNAPVYGVPTATGLTIVKYNCNAAIVTGRGSISGTPYRHTQNVLQYSNPIAVDGSDISVSDVTLLTSVNSDNIMSKLKAYYIGDVQIIRNAFKFRGERCGNVYSFTGPFHGVVNGFLTKRNLQVSSFIKSSTDFVVGYNPPKSSGYTTFVIVRSGESFIVPQDVKESENPTVRLNIIGNGSDGAVGANGEDYPFDRDLYGDNWPSRGGYGGKGGVGGEGGSGGKVYSVTVSVANVYRFDVSMNGQNIEVKSYDANGNLLSTRSSSSGTVQENGFTNVFTGVKYAMKGPDGIDGGDGGSGGWWKNANKLIPAEDGATVNGKAGGVATIGEKADSGPRPHQYEGGKGGGGATARNSAIGQKGADGGEPLAKQQNLGDGGSGGNGGGGGGGQGVIYLIYSDTVDDRYPVGGGRGGSGGQGQAGAQGGAIIYY